MKYPIQRVFGHSHNNQLVSGVDINDISYELGAPEFQLNFNP